jgi:hypothetical protein
MHRPGIAGARAMNHRTNSTPAEMNLAADYRRYEDLVQMRKTQSHADLGASHSSLVGGFSRTSSLADLAYLAVPGLTSRVVHNNSVVSLANLSDNFTQMPEHESPVVLQGGPSRPLWGSAIVALLSTLMYGYVCLPIRADQTFKPSRACVCARAAGIITGI